MTSTQLLLEGLGFPESTRWHDGRLWLCNWGAGEVLALAPGGQSEVMARLAPATIPFSIDWLPDGRMLIVDGPRGVLLRQEPDGTLTTLADLTTIGPAPFNELVVDTDGTVYVNGSGRIVRVYPDGGLRAVADGLRFPNGMAILPDQRTLVVADSAARQLLGYEIDDLGALSPARVWAELAYAPDGICADTDGAVWVATVPGERCVRVAEGGQVLATVSIDRGAFACMLGGTDGTTLFIAAARWPGMEAAMSTGPDWSGQLLAAPGQPQPHAGRP